MFISGRIWTSLSNIVQVVNGASEIVVEMQFPFQSVMLLNAHELQW